MEDHLMAVPVLPGYKPPPQTPALLYVKTVPPKANTSCTTHFDPASFYKKCQECNCDIPSNSVYNYCENV